LLNICVINTDERLVYKKNGNLLLQITYIIIFYDVMQSRSTAHSVGGGWVAPSIHPEEHPPQKYYERIAYKSIFYYVPVLSS